MKHYRPIDIARELNISTSALRHYESWGLFHRQNGRPISTAFIRMNISPISVVSAL